MILVTKKTIIGRRMIDSVTCEYILPTSGCLTDADNPPNWEEIDFQTDSFGASLFPDRYTISEDGQLYKENVKREFIYDEEGHAEVEEKDDGIERIDYTGELNLYGMHLEEETDFYFTFKALFWKGDLKECDLHECVERDNTPRKEARKKIEEAVKNSNRKQNKLVSFTTAPIFFIFSLIRYALNGIINTTIRIERILK